MSVLNATLGLDANPGVYLVGVASSAEEFARTTAEQGVRVFFLDGARIHDKASFLAIAAEAMAVPAYFGRNWDALDECIRDLAWAPATGYLLVYDRFDRFARADPAAWEIALDVFRSAIEHWQAKGVPMYVLLRGNGTVALELPTLQLPRLEKSDAPTATTRQAGV